MKQYIDYENMFATVLNLYKEAVDDEVYSRYEEEVEECAHNVALETVNSMQKYVHLKDHDMCGNFANIELDWNYGKMHFSDVIPFCSFSEMVAGMDNDTLSDAQVKAVQTWCIDWFFYAFGTFGITYNFQSWISDLEYEREREEELETA